MAYEIPYPFVLSFLHPVRPVVKKMFGYYGLFLGKTNVMLLRSVEVNPEYNGVFVATQPEHFEALSNELHSSPMEFDIDGSQHSWIFISEDLDDFEEKVRKACEMVKAGDERIGK